MRLYLAMLLPLTLLAQDTAVKKEAHTGTARHTKARKARIKKTSTTAPAPAQEPAAAAKTETKKEEKAAAESPSPKAEKALNGYIDAGARWVGWGGDFNTYRSLVNLSQGLRLVGMDVGWEPTGVKALDSMRIQAYNWGGDPYNTARMELMKKGKYRYNGTYSNIAYFNYLPSFANLSPGSPAGFNQRSIDTSVRNFENELQLFPGGRIIPYVGYSRNTSYGNGITPLVETGNEYPLRNLLRWSQNEIRGGVRLEWNRWHATLEEGGTNFKDDQTVYSTQPSTGNRTTPFLGQILSLTSGTQLYHMRGDGAYTKALITANPWNWLDLSGQFIRSNPDVTSQFNEIKVGNFTTNVGILFYQGGQDMFFGNSRSPHTSGSASAEVRPASRLRIRESWETDRFVTRGSGDLTSLFLFTGSPSVTATETDGERLEVTRSREQVEALYDIAKNYMVRGGYRYEWGHSVMKAGTFTTGGPEERAELQRHVSLAGFLIRPVSRVAVSGDFEFGDGVKTYYRTGLMDTKKYRVQGRVTLPKSMFFNVIYSRFENKNPEAGINYKYEAQTASGNLQWMPGGGKNVTVIADYTYSAIRSDINYLYPLGLFPVQSLYIDNANTGTLMTNMKLPMTSSYAGQLSFGGSFVTTAGTRPSRYYQPQGRLQLPVTPKLEFFSEWRYYGLHQPTYDYEGFRSNMFMGGLRFKL